MQTPINRNADDMSAESFFGDMIESLSGTLEEIVGVKEATSFIARVGHDMGRRIGASYNAVEGGLPSDPEGIGQLLCDFKERIGGHFELVSADAEKLVFTASRCPFGDRVKGRPSLCMMTTNVFGRIVADANGYASVKIDEAISLGHSRCHVTVHLDRSQDSNLNEFFT